LNTHVDPLACIPRQKIIKSDNPYCMIFHIYHGDEI
jgi:hypothetical protein